MGEGEGGLHRSVCGKFPLGTPPLLCCAAASLLKQLLLSACHVRLMVCRADDRWSAQFDLCPFRLPSPFPPVTCGLWPRSFCALCAVVQVHGTCLGMETLSIVISKNYTILGRYNAEVSSPPHYRG